MIGVEHQVQEGLLEQVDIDQTRGQVAAN